MTKFLGFFFLLLSLEVGAAPVGCVAVSEYCTVGKAKRIVQDFEIERECWEKQIVYSCPNIRPGGACAPLSDDPDCTQTSSECTKRDSDGVCITETNDFRCSSSKDYSEVSFEGASTASDEHGVTNKLQCGSELYCPDGVCDELQTSQTSTDFGKAASWMGLLTQMGIEKDPDAVTMFRGAAQNCAQWPLSSKDCCSEDGWLLDFFGCDENEKILAEKRKAKYTHYVGSYCSQDTFFGCITTKQSYCSFRSLFARVLQEQARSQLGIGWGSAESPDCRSLSIEEIEALDFSRIDLSEIYADMMNMANVPSETEVNNKITDRIGDYYGDSQ